MRYERETPPVRKQASDHGRRNPGGPRWPILALLVVLVVGLAGPAAAAALIGSKQVKDSSLTGVDLRDGAVHGSDVRDQSLRPEDFSFVPKGPTGPQGDPGLRGPSGTPGLTVAQSNVVVASNSVSDPVEVFCSAPQRAIFGGVGVLPDQVDMRWSAPEVDGSGWDFVLRNRTSADQSVTLQAICVVDR